MHYALLSEKERAKIDTRITKKHGELVEYTWTDVEDQVDAETSEVTKVPVERTYKYYVGNMTPQQTSGVISILATIFVNGMSAKEAESRADNIAFLEFLDGYHLTLLVSLVLGEDQAWVEENWDITQVFKVMGTFFRYNNFFDLLRSLVQMVQGMGITEEMARKAALGAA